MGWADGVLEVSLTDTVAKIASSALRVKLLLHKSIVGMLRIRDHNFNIRNGYDMICRSGRFLILFYCFFK